MKIRALNEEHPAGHVKQVILIRKDLKMRRGKEISQGAHASISFLSHKLRSGEPLSAAEQAWIDGAFAKICLQVSSEEELKAAYEAAKAAGLVAHLITDSGATEFGGVPTPTAVAIGPDYSERIDPITRHLSLY